MQKIAHQLSNKPAKLMSKVYRTNEKYLVTTHRPETIPNTENEIDIIEPETYAKPRASKWTPINQHFFTDTDSDDDETPDSNDNQKRIPIKFEQEHNELEWDHTPEQYSFMEEDETEINVHGLFHNEATFTI